MCVLLSSAILFTVFPSLLTSRYLTASGATDHSGGEKGPLRGFIGGKTGYEATDTGGTIFALETGGTIVVVETGGTIVALETGGTIVALETDGRAVAWPVIWNSPELVARLNRCCIAPNRSICFEELSSVLRYLTRI
jgi:hypothetical protein